MPEEPKPMEKSLADQRVEKILTEIHKLETEIQEIKKVPEIPLKTEPKHHFDPKDLETDCPECKKNIEDWIGSISSKTLKERASYPFVCDHCGTGIAKTEEEARKIEACPGCGSRGAARTR